jgi:hypothetical protein
MRELQIVECIFDQLLRQGQESGEKRVHHLHLAPVEFSELDQVLFKHTGKNTAKAHVRNTHNCTSVLSLRKCSVWLASRNIIPPRKKSVHLLWELWSENHNRRGVLC